MNDNTKRTNSLGQFLCDGESRRMGRNKALLPWSESHTLLTYMIQKGIDAGFTNIILAVGIKENAWIIEKSLQIKNIPYKIHSALGNNQLDGSYKYNF